MASGSGTSVTRNAPRPPYTVDTLKLDFFQRLDDGMGRAGAVAFLDEIAEAAQAWALYEAEAEVRALREAVEATWWVHDGKGVYWCGVCDGGELTLSPPPSPPWDERIADIEHEPHCIVPRVLAPEPSESG